MRRGWNMGILRGSLVMGVVALLALLPALSRAEVQFRELRLVDGRIYRGEVVDTTDTALKVRIPAGVVEINFEDVAEVLPIDPVAAADGTVLRMAILPIPGDAQAAKWADSMLGAQAQAFAGITVLPAEGISQAILQAALDCGADAACVARAVTPLKVHHVLRPTLQAGEEGSWKLTLEMILVAGAKTDTTLTLPVLPNGWGNLANQLPSALANGLRLAPDALPKPVAPPPAALTSPPLPAVASPPVTSPVVTPPVVIPPVVTPPVVASPTAPLPAPVTEPIPATAIPAPVVAAPPPAPLETPVVAVPPPEVVPTTPSPSPAPAAAPPIQEAPLTPSTEPVPASPSPEVVVVVPPPTATAPVTAPSSSTGSVRVKMQRPKSLGVVVVLGFLPLPGIANAYSGDVPGFVANIAINLAQGFSTVTVVGYTAENARSFWAGSILLPYFIGVAVNEVTGVLGFRRMQGKMGTARFQMAPEVGPEGVSGVRLGISGDF